MKNIIAVLIWAVGLMQSAQALATSCYDAGDCFCGPSPGGQYALAVAHGDGAFLIQRAWGPGAEPLPEPDRIIHMVDAGTVDAGTAPTGAKADAGTIDAGTVPPEVKAKADAGATPAPFVVGQVVTKTESGYLPVEAKVAQTQWLLYRYIGYGGTLALSLWQVKGGLIRCEFADGPSWTVEKWLSRFAHAGCVANSNAEIPPPTCSDGCSMSSRSAESSSRHVLLLILALITYVSRCGRHLHLVSKRSRHLVSARVLAFRRASGHRR